MSQNGKLFILICVVLAILSGRIFELMMLGGLLGGGIFVLKLGAKMLTEKEQTEEEKK